LWRGFTVFQKF